jgi:hypothetical protein
MQSRMTARTPSDSDSIGPTSGTRLWAGRNLILLEDRYRRAFANSLGKVQGVPIGKPYAAMRLGFADLFRTWCPMDSIARLGQINPKEWKHL